MENEIVKYIDYKVSTLSPQYPNVDFKLLRENAIQSFSGRTEPLEVLKQYIDAFLMISKCRNFKEAYLNVNNLLSKNNITTVLKK